MLFAGNALHTDLAPEAAGSAIYGWLLCMLGQSDGFPVPEGGSGAIVDALVGSADDRRRRGCRLDTRSRSIHVEGGRAAWRPAGQRRADPGPARGAGRRRRARSCTSTSSASGICPPGSSTTSTGSSGTARR